MSRPDAPQATCDPTKLDYVYEDDDLYEIARSLDTRKVGRINYLSFASMFNERLSQKQTLLDVDDLVGQHICTTIWANDVVLCKAFRCFDGDGLGCLRPPDFQAALDTMNAALADPYQPFSSQQIESLVESLPLNEAGLIDFNRFMRAFEVYDTTRYSPAS